MLIDVRSRTLRLACGDTHGSLVAPGDPQRADVEAYVAATYRHHHGARLRSFLPGLLAFRDGGGALQAVVGLRRAGDGELFVEQYLDAPAEVVASRRAGRVVERRHVVEVGNLAVSAPGDVRALVAHLTAALHQAGLRWVVFTATRQLRNTFARIGLATVELAAARPERLRGDPGEWGSYYAVEPVVVLGDLDVGLAWLQARPPGRAPALDLVARSA